MQEAQLGRKRASGRGGRGLVLGIAIGVALGVAMDNIAIGIAIGVAIGIAIDARQQKKPPRKDAFSYDDSGSLPPR